MFRCYLIVIVIYVLFIKEKSTFSLNSHHWLKFVIFLDYFNNIMKHFYIGWKINILF
jgi:hypothetical protein